jgi:beta-mannosidase
MLISIQPPSGKTVRRRLGLRAPVGRSLAATEVEIAKPQLWWPNGMGQQPLYRVTAELVAEEKLCDRRELEIGLRTVDIDRAPLRSGGSRFCIRVNGKEIFCKGGNWIPADAILARVNQKKYETLVADAKNANINMLRVWGGGIYESPAFYEACDRAGILVWQDFMFSCALYPDEDEEFCNLVRTEAEAVIRQLRHHPCIAPWCGNNENIWGFAEWWNQGKVAGDRDLRIGGSVVYNQILPDACRALDPARPYWPSSPFGGDSPNCETDGDCHWWLPFTMNPDINRRISHEVFDECRGRFVSEYGVIGPCHPDSVKQYLKHEERHVNSRAWKEHTNTFENATIPAAIQRHYADVAELDISKRTLFAQLFQASMYGRTIEALRFRKNDPTDDCQGALIWMYNDCWGETGWTPIDYYLRRKPSYYWIRNACAPTKAIVRRRKNALVTRIVNDTLHAHEVEAHYGWMRVDGSDARMQVEPLTLPANGVREVCREPIPIATKLDPREWIYIAYLTGDGIEMCPSISLLAPYRELVTAEPDIRVTRSPHEVQLVSQVYCHAVHCEDGGRPLLSDNYFDLLPGVPKSVEIVATKLPGPLRFRALTTRHGRGAVVNQADAGNR